MRIGCTKKLLEELNIEPVSPAEEEDFFCWSAHLVIVNRRKAVIIVNDSSRLGFILYGLKAKDFNYLDELILLGIKESLLDEKIKEEIIETYLEKAGDIVFAKTRGPKYVSRINKACEWVNVFSDTLEKEKLYQFEASRSMNHELIKVSKEAGYEYPHELLRQDFEKFAGEPVIRCEAVDLMVQLNLGKYTATRRIITPSDITYQKFHEILQAAFNWKNYHLYDFTILDEAGNRVLIAISETENANEPRQDAEALVFLDTEVMLSDYANDYNKMVYCYDFGDNWRHEIIIRDVIVDYDKNYPTCVLGDGNTPPEDVGGIIGYAEFLAVMSDPTHAEYENMCRWAESQFYQSFDMDMVNRRLKNVLR